MLSFIGLAVVGVIVVALIKKYVPAADVQALEVKVEAIEANLKAEFNSLFGNVKL